MSAISNESKAPITTAESTGVSSATAARRRRRMVINTLRILLLVVIIGNWELTTRVGIVDLFFWGQPSGIWTQLFTWVTQGTAQGPLWEQVVTTLEETVLGVVCGVVLGRNRFRSYLLSPFIKVANSIPRIVLGSIFVIALGLDMQSKVALAAVMVFFIVFYNAFQGVREVDRNLLANARILGANQRQLSTAVIIPSALTWITASLHTSFSFALVGAVVGEYLGSTQGIGLMIQTAQGTFNANGIFAAMVILAVLALLAELLITALENRLISWRPNTISDVAM